MFNMSIGKRINQRIHALGLTRGDVLRYIGATKGALSKWINDEAAPSGQFIVPLCEVLKCSADYLLEGAVPQGDNISPATYSRGLVPVISKIQATTWRQEFDEFQPGMAEEFLPCPRKHSRSTYALRVEGDSMTSFHGGKSYPGGCLIFCDPEAAVTSGDCVVAQLKGEDQVTFKQFIQEGQRKFLRPLNQSFPTITDPFKVLAKVIGKWEDS